MGPNCKRGTSDELGTGRLGPAPNTGDEPGIGTRIRIVPRNLVPSFCRRGTNAHDVREEKAY